MNQGGVLCLNKGALSKGMKCWKGNRGWYDDAGWENKYSLSSSPYSEDPTGSNRSVWK